MDELKLQQHKLEHFELSFGIDKKLKKSIFGMVEPRYLSVYRRVCFNRQN